METVKEPASIISESMTRNDFHTLSHAEKVDTFDQGGGQYSIANIKFAAKESPWQKALLSQDVKNAHRIIRAAMNLAEPATEETKHEMAKQFFRQFNHLLGSTADTSLKEKIQAVGGALITDPDLKKAKKEVDAEQTVSGRNSPAPATEAAEFSSRSDSFKTSPERGQSPVRDPKVEEYLSIEKGGFKYSDFVNEVLGSKSDTLRLGSALKMWSELKKDDELRNKALDQLSGVLRDIAGSNDSEALAEVASIYRESISSVVGAKNWAAVLAGLK